VCGTVVKLKNNTRGGKYLKDLFKLEKHYLNSKNKIFPLLERAKIIR
jgi:hypothetical protein